jgi:hypothetical protein
MPHPSLFLATFIVSSVYCPPNKNISQQRFIHFLDSLGPKFLAGGDWNAKHPQWGCRVANPRSAILQNTFSYTDHIVLSPPQPTYRPTSKRPNLLDYFIASSSFSNISHQLLNMDYPTSDHSPILLILDTVPIPFPIPTPPLKPSLINGPLNIKQFQQHNISLNIPLKNTTDIEQAVQTLTKAIQNSI